MTSLAKSGFGSTSGAPKAWTKRRCAQHSRRLGAPSGKVARLELRPTYSYAFVAEADAPAFEQLDGRTHAGKALKIERARRR